MADFKVRFNLETEDVELVLNDKVVDTVGTDVFQSWARAYNQKHGYKKPVEEVKTETEEKETKEDDKSNEEGQSSSSED